MRNLKIDQLTFTRFIAAFSIVVLHFGARAFPFNVDNISFIFKQASTAVSYFFILSGFVMIIAYNNKSKIESVEYIKSRFARIYPIYLLAILILLIYYALSNNINFENLLLNIFLIQAWQAEKALTFNPAGWSLSVEFFFYLLFPFLFNKVYKKFSYKKIIWFISIFWIISQFSFHFMIYYNWPVNGSNMYCFPLMHLNAFLAGNMAGLFYLNNDKIKSKNFDLPILAVIFLIILAFKFPFGLNYHNGMLALLFVPFIVLVSLNNGLITTIFKNKVFIFLGEISYGIYILQFPISAWISDFRLLKYLNIEKASNLNFYIKLVALLVLSSLSYIYIEKPIRERMKKQNLQSVKVKRFFLFFKNKSSEQHLAKKRISKYLTNISLKK